MHFQDEISYYRYIK